MLGEFTEIACQGKGWYVFRSPWRAAKDCSLFALVWEHHRSLRSLTEIDDCALPGAATTPYANPGLLDWIEVTGVPTGSSSANADRDVRRTLAQPDLLRKLRAGQEVSKEICPTLMNGLSHHCAKSALRTRVGVVIYEVYCVRGTGP